MLKMQVAIPAPTMDFDFNDSRPMPFLSVPSTPKRFGDYSLSAPSSPSRMAEFYRSFQEESKGIPFHREEKPGTPTSPKAGTINYGDEDEGFDFAFDISGDQDKGSVSAEELFDGGKIRPLKPPPRLQFEEMNQRTPLLSPRSPRSPRSPIAQGKKIIRDVFSPRMKKDHDPFAAAVENTRKRTENERGRERVPTGLASNPSRRAARSLSPYRVSAYPWEEEQKQQQQQDAKPSDNSSKLSLISKGSSRKWRLKDFLLFRSASEGHASDKDHYRKYPALFRRHEDVKDSSFRSSESSSSASGSSSRRRGKISAHELHYTANKAASAELKKKTFLPYKLGIFF